jgi:Domain of unknown function (DUF4037)
VTAPFIPGLELARSFYAEIVGPLLAAEYPGLPHSAALIGWGSEVLGFDSERSADHNWGPRLQIFLADETEDQSAEISDLLGARMPAEFRGYPTVFPASDSPDPPSHWVTVAGLRSWLTGELGFDPTARIGLLDWLSVPTQTLAGMTGGAVFHDGLPARTSAGADSATAGMGARHGPVGGLTAVRAALAWYPRDVWRYVLACQWQRISQEEAFPGRCAEAADDLGSALVTARLARDVMRLALLMERRYPPYSKWLGTAFGAAAVGSELQPLLITALAATTWAERQRSMSAAYEAAARLHNKTGLTPPLDPAIRPSYYERPYQVPDSGRFVRALRAQISDDRLRALPLIGAADQFIDSTDALGSGTLRRAVAAELGLPFR